MTVGTFVTSLFPNGIGHYALGGVLIGLATASIYLGTGRHVGASTVLESTLSYVSSIDRFARPDFLESRDWRVVFTIGIVAGGTIAAVATGEFGWTTEVQWWRLLGGGLLVGVGTRLGKGCTSGHGICGVGSGSRASILNVVVFMVMAIGTALLVAALGVTP